LGFAVAVAAFVGATQAQAAAETSQAIVRGVRGTANYSLDRGANWKPLKVGTGLKQNSIIRTAPGATVDLFLGDNGPVVRVTEDTTMGIDRLTIDKAGPEKVIETQLDLRNGRILGNVKKLAQTSKYEVKTPQGVAGIRGTRYDIRADGTVTVIEGQVVVVYVVNGQTSTVTVNAGETARPPLVAGGPPQLGPATPGEIQFANTQINEATEISMRTVTTEQEIIVTVTPIIEAFQEGDRAKIETNTTTGQTTPTNNDG
jgi:ferric-dicitrate binding protein FerR (iron transport regulator)